MRILITGAAGFIGSHFTRLMDRHHDIILLDKSGYLLRINGVNRTVLRKDLSVEHNIKGILHGIDVVVNFAAETFVDYSIKNPRKFLESNIIGTFNLLHEARKTKLKNFIQVSTDEVYGSILRGSFDETALLTPGNPYSASKAAGDMLCLSYANTYGIPVTIVRPENNYGAMQGAEKLIPCVINKMLKGQDVILYGDGKHRRMWLHVDDTCLAIKHLIESPYLSNIYNIGSCQEKENVEIVRLIGEVLKVPYNVKFVADKEARPGHDYRYAINTTKLSETGFKPRHKLEESLPEVVNWYKNNQWWFKC